MLEGWEYPVPLFLRKKRSKIFLADDPVPGSMNKIFKLDVDLRYPLVEPYPKPGPRTDATPIPYDGCVNKKRISCRSTLALGV